jgi:hypothetical protein
MMGRADQPCVTVGGRHRSWRDRGRRFQAVHDRPSGPLRPSNNQRTRPPDVGETAQRLPHRSPRPSASGAGTELRGVLGSTPRLHMSDEAAERIVNVGARSDTQRAAEAEALDRQGRSPRSQLVVQSPASACTCVRPELDQALQGAVVGADRFRQAELAKQGAKGRLRIDRLGRAQPVARVSRRLAATFQRGT